MQAGKKSVLASGCIATRRSTRGSSSSCAPRQRERIHSFFPAVRPCFFRRDNEHASCQSLCKYHSSGSSRRQPYTTCPYWPKKLHSSLFKTPFGRRLKKMNHHGVTTLRFLLVIFCSISAAAFLPSIVSSRGFAHSQVVVSATKKQRETLPSRSKKNNHEKWQPFYDALAVFKETNGHCNVSDEENPDLYQWLEDQKTSYKNLQLGRKTKLTKKRAAALEMIGAIPAELLDL